MAANALHVRSFNVIVEFLFECAGEFLNNFNRPLDFELFYMVLGKGGQMKHNFEINFDDFLDAGSLKFYRHRFTVF